MHLPSGTDGAGSTAVVLHGDGFELRGLTDADAPAWLAGEDADTLWAFEMPAAKLADVHRAIREWRHGWEAGGGIRQWGIFTEPEGRLAGGVELRDLGDWAEANLSYVVFAEFRRRGLATGAARLAIEYARGTLSVRAVRLAMLQDNERSRRVAQRLGATLVSTAPSDAGSTFDVFRLVL